MGDAPQLDPEPGDAERRAIAERDKRIRNVIARAAVAGWTASIVGPGPLFMFARWGYTLERYGLEEAERFVAQWGGR